MKVYEWLLWGKKQQQNKQPLGRYPILARCPGRFIRQEEVN